MHLSTHLIGTEPKFWAQALLSSSPRSSYPGARWYMAWRYYSFFVRTLLLTVRMPKVEKVSEVKLLEKNSNVLYCVLWAPVLRKEQTWTTTTLRGQTEGSLSCYKSQTKTNSHNRHCVEQHGPFDMVVNLTFGNSSGIFYWYAFERHVLQDRQNNNILC